MPLSVHHPRYQALRAELVALRKSADLTQVQLAQRLDVGQSYVSKIERGETYVDVLVFIDWCVACGAGAGQVLEAMSPDARGAQAIPRNRAPSKR